MKIQKLIFCFWALLGLSTISNAQIAPVLKARLDFVLDSMRIDINPKSFSAAIQLPNNSIWTSTSGYSTLNPYNSATPEDAYLIGSVTKMMTAACVLQLVDEQVLTLKDSLYKWLDPMPNINPNITIKQLLRHQSGIYDVLENERFNDSLNADFGRIWTPEELISEFSKPAIFQPGASWSYCNTNYFLLGMIIKKATGKYYYEQFRERFFTPMALDAFAIPAFEPINVPIAHVWLDLNGDGTTDDAHNFYMNYLSLNSMAGASGGYFTTPAQLARWTRAHGRGELFSPAMQIEAKTMVGAPGTPGGSYGLGLMRKSFQGVQGFGHGGDLGYAAQSWYFPSRDISISVATNDGQRNSWTMLPVVEALLRNYIAFQSTSASNEGVAPTFALSAFPNPMSDHLTVAIHAPKSIDEVVLVLTNALGVTVGTLRQTDLPSGDSNLTFDQIGQIPSGIYWLKTYVNGKYTNALKVNK